MPKQAGRRRATKRRRIPALGWMATAIAIGLASVTAVAVFANPDDDSPGAKTDAADMSATVHDVEARGACTDATTIAVPEAYLDAWKQVTAEFEPDRACLPMRLTPVPSAAFALGTAPAVGAWIPEDASWIDRAARSVWQGSSASSASPVARTPVVVATSAQLNQSVGGIQNLLTPKALGPLVVMSKSFADFGDDTAGTLRIALPDPSGSATGGLGFAALVQAATGRALAQAPSYVNPSAADLTTIKTEHRVVAVAEDDAAALADLDTASPTKANVSVTTEQAALAQMKSSGDDNLAVGYLGADLAMSVVAVDKAAQPIVDELVAYVASPDGATALTEAGLRPATGAIAPAAIGAVDPAVYTDPGATGSAEQLTGLGYLFSAMHQRISTLVLLDASGSMLQPLPGSDVSKIDLVRRAARDTLQVASPSARAGLMTFRSDAADRPVITTPVPLAPNGQRTNGELHSTAMRRAVDTLKVDGGTPLYNAVRDAYRVAQQSYDPAMINQIVLLSDGRNQDAQGSISLPKLLQTLRAERDPKRPVRIIAIGYGPDADMAALNEIVAVTKGRASWLQNVEGYSGAVQEALFSA